MELSLHYIAACCILLVLLFVAREDYQTFKIRNTRILQVLLVGVLYYATVFFPEAYALYFLPEGWQVALPSFSDFAFALKSVGVSAFVAIILWYFDLWGAGDAKLFIALSFSVPSFFLQAHALHVFPAFALLVNIFFLTFLILVCKFLYFPFSYFAFSWRNKNLFLKMGVWAKKSIKDWFTVDQIKRHGLYLIGFLSIYMIFQFFRSYVVQYLGVDGFDNYPFILSIFALFVLFYHGRKLLNNVYFIAVISSIAFGYLVHLFFTVSTEVFVQTLITLIVLGTCIRLIIHMLIWLYVFYIHFMETESIPVQKLKPGMIIDTMPAEFLGYEPLKDYLKTLKRKKLTAYSVKKLNKLFQEYFEYQSGKEVIEKLQVYKLTHFGIWFFVGTMLTVILKGSIFHYILSYIV